MTHDEKVAYLLRDLGGREIRPSTIAPPMYRQLWHLGLEVRPPHFASFWWNAGLRAFLFAAILVVSNSLISWWQGYGLLPALAAALVGGVIIGVYTATFYRRQARRLGLPRWEDYPTP
jgi:hypothetical protein